MVLSRQPKKYKHLMRTMLTQLVEYENITTTKAKAQHLRSHGEKLLNFARKAESGKTSPLNLLKGRVHTEKAYTKLLVDIIPRIKHLEGNFLNFKDLHIKRKGDNAPMVQVSIKGNEKTEFEKKRRQESIEKGETVDIKAYHAKILSEEKEFLEGKEKENNENVKFIRQKIKQVKFQQFLVKKEKTEPPKYTLLV